MKRNFNSILVATDFSEKSLAALEESYNLAKLTRLKITLIHVIRDSGQSLLSVFESDNSRKLQKEYEDQIRAELIRVAEDASKKSGVPVNAVISRGKEYDKILKSAKLLESKFIVMGLNAEPFAVNKDYIGSITSKVIRNATCPVITVNNKHTFDGCRSILLPLDLTQETRQKVTNAIEFAKLFGSRIKVMSVLTSPHDKEETGRLEVQLNQVKRFIEESNIPVTAELVEKSPDAKSPAPIILKYAEDQGDIDLIMIMTQKESGLIEYFIGSSAQDIISRSKVPVMSIIPQQLGFISIFS